MKKTCVLAVWLIVVCVAGRAQAASLLFEYTGTVKTVGGSVLDGSLLGVNFAYGDVVSGCFVFESPGSPGRTPPGSYENSISAFRFGDFVAEGTQRSHSVFGISLEFGYVTGYKQVGTGSIYDNFIFLLEVPGANWTADKPVNLLSLNELDPVQFYWPHTNFVLERVDIATNPLRYTEVRVSIDSITVRPGTSCYGGVMAHSPTTSF